MDEEDHHQNLLWMFDVAEKISDHILGNDFLPPQTVNYKNKTAA